MGTPNGRTVAGGMRVIAAAVAVGFLLVTACASLRFGGAAALKIECNVPDAALYIDDVFVGYASEWAVDGRFVKPGFHRIELRDPDHFTHYADVTLTKGDAVLLRPQMRPLLD